jgi:hypothetical protein
VAVDESIVTVVADGSLVSTITDIHPDGDVGKDVTKRDKES